MSDAPATRPTLLVRLRDPLDEQAWSQFAEIYVPLVYGFARKHGLQDADAADLTQDVLRSVSAAIGRWDYDPLKGTFRGWLFTVARNKLRDFLSSQARHGQGTGDTALHTQLAQHPDRTADELAEWEQEYQRQLFHCAAEVVRSEVEPHTWQAFWAAAVEGRPPKLVAADLGISVAAVYMAKSRVMARIKQKVRELQAEEAG
jgi:RNA polymerase sigma-70 factor (ECF subfamily)